MAGNTKTPSRKMADAVTELAQIETILKMRKVKAPPVVLTNQAFRRFQARYRADPVAFIHDCFEYREHEHIAPYEDEIADALVRHHRVAAYGPRGLGKSAIAARLIWWANLTVDDVKIPTTASAWQQLTNYLWPEVHKWHSRMRWNIIGRGPLVNKFELMSTEIHRDGKKDALAFAAASTDSDRIEGAHSLTRVMLVFDESKAIQDATFDSSEGAHSQCAEPLALALSTPGAPIGRFFEICTNRDGKYSDWWVKHVTKDEQIAAGRMDSKWAENRRITWGEASPMYQNHVLGHFAQDDLDAIIPWALLERAFDNWKQLNGHFGPITSIGVDVGGGGDASVVALASGNVITRIEERDFRSTMETTGWVAGLAKAYPDATVVVDVVGIGSGVFYRLKEQGLNVLPFNAAEKSDGKDKSGEIGFRNKRAEVWWGFREKLDEPDSDIALPYDSVLIGELTTPKRKTMLSSGLIQIESKDDIRKRLSGRSTNRADAVLMAILGATACTRYETTVIHYADYLERYPLPPVDDRQDDFWSQYARRD